MDDNADGRRELLGLKVGDSESEPFWSEFIGSLIAGGFCEAVKRGLTGVRLVISDAHKGLTNAIRRMLQGSSWQRCLVHHRFAEGFAYARNLLQRVPKAHQSMVRAPHLVPAYRRPGRDGDPVTAALRSVFAQEEAVSSDTPFWSSGDTKIGPPVGLVIGA